MDSQFDFGLYYHNLEYNYLKLNGSAEINAQEGNSTKPSAVHTEAIISVGHSSNHDVLRAINHINVASGGSSLANNPTIGGAILLRRLKAQTHAAITFNATGLSWIYYGDELGMSGTSQDNATNANNMDRWYRSL